VYIGYSCFIYACIYFLLRFGHYFNGQCIRPLPTLNPNNIPTGVPNSPIHYSPLSSVSQILRPFTSSTGKTTTAPPPRRLKCLHWSMLTDKGLIKIIRWTTPFIQTIKHPHCNNNIMYVHYILYRISVQYIHLILYDNIY